MKEWELEYIVSKYKYSILRRRLKSLKEFGYTYKTYIEKNEGICVMTFEIIKDNILYYIDIYDVNEEERETHMEYILEDIYDYIKVNELIRDIIIT